MSCVCVCACVCMCLHVSVVFSCRSLRTYRSMSVSVCTEYYRGAPACCTRDGDIFSAAAQTTAILCHRPAFLMHYKHAYVNTQKISGVELYGSVCDVRASAARDVSALFALYVCTHQVNVDLLRVVIAWYGAILFARGIRPSSSPPRPEGRKGRNRVVL